MSLLCLLACFVKVDLALAAACPFIYLYFSDIRFLCLLAVYQILDVFALLRFAVVPWFRLNSFCPRISLDLVGSWWFCCCQLARCCHCRSRLFFVVDGIAGRADRARFLEVSLS